MKFKFKYNVDMIKIKTCKDFFQAQGNGRLKRKLVLKLREKKRNAEEQNIGKKELIKKTQPNCTTKLLAFIYMEQLMNNQIIPGFLLCLTMIIII